MTVQGSQLVPRLVGAGVAVLYWGFSFWRIVRKNRGNMVIECGSITIMIFLTMAILSRVINLPDWAFGSLLALVFLLCITTLIFFIIEVARRFSSKKTGHRKRHLKSEFPEAHR